MRSAWHGLRHSTLLPKPPSGMMCDGSEDRSSSARILMGETPATEDDNMTYAFAALAAACPDVAFSGRMERPYLFL
jgi:hypothetical protein